MRRIVKAVLRRATWANGKWFLKTNAQSWGLQFALAALLTATGGGLLVAAVNAKLTAYAVWLAQLLTHARGE